MTITTSDPSAEVAYRLLKLHRNEEPLQTIFPSPPGVSDEDSILSCSKEEHRKMRALYQYLFGIAKNSNLIKQQVDEFFQNVTFSEPQPILQRVQYFFSEQQIYPSYTNLLEKLVIVVLLEMEPTKDLIALVKKIQKVEDFKEAPEFYECTKNSPMWRKLESLGLNRNQQISSLMILLATTVTNVRMSLTFLTENCMRSPQILTDIKNELVKAEAGEPSLASDLIRRTINESLRHSPVVLSFKRKTSQSLNLSDFRGPNQTVPANTVITIDLASFAANPKIVGENPERFCPYRQTAVKDRSQENGFLPGYPSIPFGHGANQCPAWKWYSIIAEATLEKLARQYG